MKFLKTANTALVESFRKALYSSLVAPLDGMWEVLYIASAQAYLIENKGGTIGFCCIDEQDSLLQIYLSDDNRNLMDLAICTLLEQQLISTAKLSSMEPISFNICLFHSKSIQTNTFCFQHGNYEVPVEPLLNLELATKGDLPIVKAFLKDQIAFDDNFGYTENLIHRKEQYLLKDGDSILATGECRMSDSQAEVADLGVIVNRDFQKKGLGTQVLHQLATIAREAKRKPICSTTLDNVASKKAIERAGFYCSHIIFDINFQEKTPEK